MKIALFQSIRRIQKFLELPELSQMDGRNILIEAQEENQNVALSLDNVSCFWDFNTCVNSENTSDEGHLLSNGILALDNINVELRMNELTCVVGCVGAGKR